MMRGQAPKHFFLEPLVPIASTSEKSTFVYRNYVMAPYKLIIIIIIIIIINYTHITDHALEVV